MTHARESFVEMHGTDGDLDRFAVWWLRNTPVAPPADCVNHFGGFTAMTLYRDGQFQVQMITATKRTEVPHHTHPNVDSLEKLISGDLELNVARENSYRRGFLEIRNDDDHWGAMKDAGAFYSFQKWRNDVRPTSIHLDWMGDAMDERPAEGVAA